MVGLLTWAGWLIALAGPLVMRALMVVGFSAVTFTGVQTVINTLISSAQSSWSAAPAMMLQLASLAGLPEAAGVMCGAFLARITLWIGAQSVKLLFTGAPA